MKKLICLSLSLLTTYFTKSQTSNAFTVTNNSGTNVLTCNLTQIDLTVNTTVVPPWSFQWSGPATNITGTQVSLSQPGTYTVTMLDSLNAPVGSQSITITSNTVAPSVFLSPLSQMITCTLSSITDVTAAVTPTTNVTQYFTSPMGGSLVVSSYTTVYPPLSPGVYTHCAVDNVNGCKTCNTFTVNSNQAFPSFSLSTSNNYALGCATKSVESVFFNNGTSSGGGVIGYTLFPPGSSIIFPPNPGPITAYTVTAPGTYTAAIFDPNTGCMAATPFSIITNTLSPSLSITANNLTVTCASPQVTLLASSTETNLSYLWSYAPTPAGYTVSSVVITSASPVSNPTLGVYSVTITNNENLCTNTQSVSVYRNIYSPNALITSSLGITGVTCKTPTLTLMNQSTSGIPGAQFPNVLPVIVQQWAGPFTDPGSPTYVAGVPGVYTMTAIDLNNGCTKEATFIVQDNRQYPVLTFDNIALLPCPGDATLTVYPSNTTANYSYTWTAPANATVSGVNSSTLVTTTPGAYSVLAEDVQNGCKKMISIDVWACVGMAEQQKSLSLSVFPNPSEGLYELTFNNVLFGEIIEVFNLNGQQIKEVTVNSEKNELDLGDFNSGIYFLRIKNHPEKGSIKIIKE
ncbi:MAG: T9SS type A sorting domain-containing protein [Bacteroidia bacterium]|nr:T9SS type A sorting domain-containing protein [Bacteroidia bacterium]